MSPPRSGRAGTVVGGGAPLPLLAARAAPATAAPARTTPAPTAILVPISNCPMSPTVPRALKPSGTDSPFAAPAGGSTTMPDAVATDVERPPTHLSA